MPYNTETRDRPLRRKLREKIAWRLVVICFFGCLTGYLFVDSSYWLAGIWTLLITFFLFVHTIRFVDHAERKLTTFLLALRQNDFALTFPENPKADDYDLHRAFNELNSIFKRLRSERESQHQLLQVVVEQTSAPMICFEESNGEVYIINHAAKQLLQIPVLQKIEALSRIDFELPQIFRSIPDGEKKSHRLARGGKVIFLTINSCHILFDNRNLKLIALQDVTSELAAREAETWHKLLRVLTHEISNSAIPLSTLSSFIYEMVIRSREENRELTEVERQDIMTSLKTIDQRSRTLKEFVQNFRMVGQVPEPRLEKISASALVRDSIQLFSKEFTKENIHWHFEEADNILIYTDRSLTQQVLINLFKNAIEAMSNLKENKNIQVRLIKEGSRHVQLMVRDTGTGISPEDIEQIFIPFFTTKKGGSGIGLSISKQIMQKQKGTINVQSELGKGSTFILGFLC